MKRKIFADIGRKITVPMAAVAIVGGAMFPQIVSAKASVATERSWENWQMSEDQTKYTMTQAQKGSMLREIQDSLVEHNSDELNYKDDTHPRWIQPAWLNQDTERTRSYSMGGYLVITQNEINDYTNGSSISPTSIIKNSLIATDIAHESAHYVNEDTRNRVTDTKKGAIESEYKADAKARELLARVPEFSVGSQLTAELIWTEKGSQKGNDASLEKRIQDTLDYIQSASGGKVSLSRNSYATIDKKPLCGTGILHNSAEATGAERTAYIAGQIATCMSRGIWSRNKIDYAPESEIFKGGSKAKTVLFVREEEKDGNPSGDIAKILGTFEFPLDANMRTHSSHETDEINAVNWILDCFGKEN